MINKLLTFLTLEPSCIAVFVISEFNLDALKTQYCPLSINRCDLMATIFVRLKILRLLFTTRTELVNNRRLAPMKTKTTTEARKAYWPILRL